MDSGLGKLATIRGQSHSFAMKNSPKTRYVPSYYYGLIICGVSSLLLGLVFPELELALLILLSLSGPLALSDFLDAMRGMRDIFAPRTLISALMFHTTYITPILHIGLDAYPLFLVLPQDMSLAFFDHALLQGLCVTVYFISLRVFSSSTRKLPQPAPCNISHRRTAVIKWLNLIGIVSFFVFLYTVAAAGGPLAWLNSQIYYREGLGSPGWLVALAEAFPSLFFMAYLVNLKSKELTKKQLAQRLIVAIILFVAVTFVTSGLRGSRANLVWPTLSIICMIHVLLYRIKGVLLAVIAGLAIIFAGIYNVYKKEGVDGIQSVQEIGLDQVSSLSAYSLGFENVLLFDFSRSAMQAVVLDRWNTTGFSPYFGATYIGDMLLFVPGGHSSDKFPNKSVAATDILYGPGAAKYTDAISTRIYGLQGEGLINFGPAGAVLVFLPLAYAVRSVEIRFHHAKQYQSVDSSILYAVLVPAVMLLYLSDLDNVLRNITSNVLLTVVALSLASFELHHSNRLTASEKRLNSSKDI